MLYSVIIMMIYHQEAFSTQTPFSIRLLSPPPPPFPTFPMPYTFKIVAMRSSQYHNTNNDVH